MCLGSIFWRGGQKKRIRRVCLADLKKTGVGFWKTRDNRSIEGLERIIGVITGVLARCIACALSITCLLYETHVQAAVTLHYTLRIHYQNSALFTMEFTSRQGSLLDSFCQLHHRSVISPYFLQHVQRVSPPTNRLTKYYEPLPHHIRLGFAV